MFRRFYADDMDADVGPEFVPHEPEIIIENVPSKSLRGVPEDEEEVVYKEHKKHSFLAQLLITIAIFVVLVALGMYLYGLFQKSNLNTQLDNIGNNLFGPAGQQVTPIGGSGLASPQTMFPSSLFASSVNVPATSINPGPAVMVPGAQHTLMTRSNSHVSAPMVPQQYLQQRPQGPMEAMAHNRVHFYYDGEDDKDSRKMYREYTRLRKQCARKQFHDRYGPVMFHKWDMSKPEGKQYFSQINLSGTKAKRNFPFSTFGRKGAYEESVLGTPDSSSKDMLKQMLQQMQTEKSNQ